VTGDPAELTLVELLPLLGKRELSARELTEACLRRVAAAEPLVRAFVTLTPERALAAADAADADRAAGRPVGALAGVPVGVKDLYLTAGTPTTASSRVLAGWDPGLDSAVWERLRAAGAGLLGKTTTHEFAYGTASAPSRNPWDPARTPGGSSGGSAAALAARMVPLATGSDTGGSLRIPAAACGISALRPAAGRVSAYGVVPLSPSFDTVGPMARRLLDVSLVLRLLAGHDPRDRFSGTDPVPAYPDAAAEDLRGVRVGLPVELLWGSDVDGEILAACRAAVRVLADHGAEVVEIPVPPSTDRVFASPQTTYDIICGAEARQAHRDLIADRDLVADDAGYSPQVLARLRAGEAVTAVDYLSAWQLRREWTAAWRALFAEHRLTAVAHPAIAAHPPLVDPDRPPLGPAIRHSIAWSITGFPSLSVPAGRSPAGLPIGISLAALPADEARLVAIGAVIDEHIALWREPPPLLPR
jgi:aspartyl-tRNA(Asn)/glutamyl-tRNA(Gln) amidotransferase subunit A